MTVLSTRAAATAAALAATLLAPAALDAQQRKAPAAQSARRGFDLFAVVDFAATGMRAPTGTYRFLVTNAGPIDVTERSVSPAAGVLPATVVRSGTFYSQFPEVTLFAAAAPGDRAANVARVPSLGNVTGGGAALSFNFHKSNGLQVTRWYPADGQLGFSHSGVRSAPTGCLNHNPPLPPGVALMPGSDCPQTWGLNGWRGRRPVPQSSYLTVFNGNRDAFRFNYFDVPAALQDTFSFMGDRFQTYGTIVDYSRSRTPDFGNVLPGGSGAPREQGYPLGLEWQFDAFTVVDAPGVVFWQATITNKTDSIYGGGGINYDSLFVGVIARHGRRLRAHAGFDPARGAAFFNEIGNDDASNPNGCDNALAVPGNFASDAFNGTCSEPVAFAQAGSAIVFLKSPIGDLRYKLFTTPGNQFFYPTSPVRGDTITYNIGRMCGDECVADRPAVSTQAGYGVVASREALALNGDAPSSLSTLAYWMLFHPANGSSTDPARRVDLANPRAGGGFNFTTLPGWRYSTRPASAPAAGSDTLWFDTCNPTADPVATPIVVPATRTQFGRCTGRWVDTLPDRTLNFTRGATWIGAGPFRLAAGAKTSLVMAMVMGGDSATIENNVNGAVNLYQTFFIAPTPLPAPRITSVQVTGGTIRQTNVRVFFENRGLGYVDPFVTQLAARFRTDTFPTTPIGKLFRLNRRIAVAGIGSAAGVALPIADVIDSLARRQVSGHLVYKSCNPGSGEYTRASSPNFCTIDVVTDSLGRTVGPAPYATLVDTAFSFSDGQVISGRSYQYVVVPVSRGVRLQLVTDSTLVSGQVVRTVKDTVLVASRADLPTLLTAPNVATVYVPASRQAGGTPSRVRYISETGTQTFDGDSLAYSGPFVTVADTIKDTLNYRLVLGDSVKMREYLTNGALDSTVVAVYRSAAIGFSFSSALGTDPFSRFATPTRRFLDSLVFVRRSPVAVSRNIVGTFTATTNDSGTTSLGGGRTVVRTTLKNTGGARLASDQVLSAPTNVVGPLAQGVLLLRQNGVDVPVIVGNNFRSGQFGLSSRILGSPDYQDAVVDVQNRPVVTTYTPTGTTPAYGGAQIIDRFFTDPVGGRFNVAGTQSAIPTVDFQTSISRFTGAAVGEYQFQWMDNDFGPGAPFNYNSTVVALQSAFDSSLARRARAQQTVAGADVVTAINASLGTTLTQDSLLAVSLPFKIVDNSRERGAGGREVIAAIRASDKYYSPTADGGQTALPAGGIGANPSRWFQVGVGLDTARLTVPKDQWIPGEPLILLERVPIADTTAGVVRRDANGNILTRDTLVVIATRVTLGCRVAFPAFCNPVEGRGSTGYSPTLQGYTLVVRTGIPLTSDREVRFAVTPFMAGERLRVVSKAQLDSVSVVPNPYILYSSFEQGRGTEQRIMFTHLPPQGVIRIYTAAGQFVQQLSWTPVDLNGNGDLYFNLLTRENTLMASGLYVFTVQASGATGSATRSKVGRFIIIR